VHVGLNGDKNEQAKMTLQPPQPNSRRTLLPVADAVAHRLQICVILIDMTLMGYIRVAIGDAFRLQLWLTGAFIDAQRLQ
jgi:hypothetical protein